MSQLNNINNHEILLIFIWNNNEKNFFCSFNCLNNAFNQINSFAAFFKVIYLALQELIATDFCNFEDYEIGALPSKNR